MTGQNALRFPVHPPLHLALRVVALGAGAVLLALAGWGWTAVMAGTLAGALRALVILAEAWCAFHALLALWTGHAAFIAPTQDSLRWRLPRWWNPLMPPRSVPREAIAAIECAPVPHAARYGYGPVLVLRLRDGARERLTPGWAGTPGAQVRDRAAELAAALGVPCVEGTDPPPP